MLAAAKGAFEALPVRPEVRAAALANLARWLENDEFAPYHPQIHSMVARERWDLLLDSFYQVLPFGTGGRRGPVGVGPNRYNPWTLGASVQGHVAFLREQAAQRGQAGAPLHVVIAYDVRCYKDANNVYDPAVPNPCLGLSSRDFAELAAGTVTLAVMIAQQAALLAQPVRIVLICPADGVLPDHLDGARSVVAAGLTMLTEVAADLPTLTINTIAVADDIPAAEVAALARHILSGVTPSLNGATIRLDGGRDAVLAAETRAEGD